MQDRTSADDIVQGAANRALLDLILPPMRRAAKDDGYAIIVHGSLNRDIDLVAVPWTDAATGDARALSTKLANVVAGVTGRCFADEKTTAAEMKALAVSNELRASISSGLETWARGLRERR